MATLLPEEDHHLDDAGRSVRDALLRRKIDAALANAEQSLREEGGIPLADIKIEMRRRYG